MKPFIYEVYDLDRPTSAAYVGGEGEQFNYDKVGNRVSVTLRDTSTETYAVDNLTNQYDASGSYDVVQTYDDAGNTIEDHRGYLYTYDFENRLIEVAEPNQTLVAEFAYDALGRRIRKIDHAANETTLYYYNQNWQTLCETDENNVVQRCYIYGNFIDEPLMMVDADDHYYVHDHLYSTVALLNEDGSVLERYEYDAYGRPHFYDASFNLLATQASGHGNRLLFTSRPADLLDDSELPLQDNRHRILDFATGRWLQRDPLGVVPNGYIGNERFSPIAQYTDGANVYEYVKSKPIMNMDENGLALGWRSTTIGTGFASRHEYDIKGTCPALGITLTHEVEKEKQTFSGYPHINYDHHYKWDTNKNRCFHTWTWGSYNREKWKGKVKSAKPFTRGFWKWKTCWCKIILYPIVNNEVHIIKEDSRNEYLGKSVNKELCDKWESESGSAIIP